jgi:RNA polymerase sigma factor (sigma-70 family)
VGGFAAVMLGDRIGDALRAWTRPPSLVPVLVPASSGPAPGAPFGRLLTSGVPVALTQVAAPALDVDLLVADLFRVEGQSLVRLVRLFVDDRNAAEDLVQEAFIRLARSAHRITDLDRAPAYLRSIVLNLARDHNRRGLVSLRHHLPFDDGVASTEDVIELRDDQRHVLIALRDLPHRQRDCLVLRYYDELGVDAIAELLGISRNSVKTHLSRGLAGLARLIERPEEDLWT